MDVTDVTDDKNGIYIKGKRITALSGVYSTVYLKPKEKVFPSLKNADLDLPLFLLLGDRHTGICKNCTCETGSCCNIYDPTFLQDLDSLADEYHPIDFFTELFFEPIYPNSGLGISEYFNAESFRDCYDRTKRGTPDDNCPTKNIRWQFGDIRQSLYSDHNPKYRLSIEASFVAINDFFQGNYMYSSYITEESLDLLLDLFSRSSSSIDEKKDDSDEEYTHFDTDRFANRFFEIAGNSSLVIKQMHKQSYINLRDISYMSRVLKKGLNYLIDTYNIEKIVESSKIVEMLGLLRSWLREGVDLSSKFFYE
jgi:hypothetical protein